MSAKDKNSEVEIRDRDSRL